MMNPKITILDLIEDYLNHVVQVTQIFREEFGIGSNNLLRAKNDKIIPFRGEIPHRDITKYSFHGIGLFANWKDKNVDFDFYFDGGNFEIGGFDSQRLLFFAENDRIK